MSETPETQVSPGLPVNQCLLVHAHPAHDWWYTPEGGGHMLAGKPGIEDVDAMQHHCMGLSDTHSNCCWCGQGFLGPSGTMRGCRVAPSGHHEHVAGHADRHRAAFRAQGKEPMDHADLHPEKKPISLCVWCGSGYAEDESCDERPGNPSGTLGHQTRVMAERTTRREVEAAKRHVRWLLIRKALDEGDPGEAMVLFDQALDAAKHAGRIESQRLRDEAAKRKEKES